MVKDVRSIDQKFRILFERTIYLSFFSSKSNKTRRSLFLIKSCPFAGMDAANLGRIKEAYPRGMMAAFRDILSTVARKKPFYSRTSWSRDLSDFFFFPFMKTKNHRPIEFLKSTSARASITYHPELRVIAISLSFSIENLFRLIFLLLCYLFQ